MSPGTSMTPVQRYLMGWSQHPWLNIVNKWRGTVRVFCCVVTLIRQLQQRISSRLTATRRVRHLLDSSLTFSHQRVRWNSLPTCQQLTIGQYHQLLGISQPRHLSSLGLRRLLDGPLALASTGIKITGISPSLHFCGQGPSLVVSSPPCTPTRGSRPLRVLPLGVSGEGPVWCVLERQAHRLSLNQTDLWYLWWWGGDW